MKDKTDRCSLFEVLGVTYGEFVEINKEHQKVVNDHITRITYKPKKKTIVRAIPSGRK